MSSEMYNTVARVTDGIYEGESFMQNVKINLPMRKIIETVFVSMLLIGIAIGGDVFPGSTLSYHILRFNNIPQVYHVSQWILYLAL